MEQSAPSGQRGTARAGRWFSRALLVVGGALAGTAAAWVLSTTIAGATTETSAAHVATSESERGDSDLTPITNAAVHGVNHVTGGVSEFVGDATGAAVRGWQEVTGAAPSPRPMDPGFDRGHLKHRQHRVIGAGQIDETAADQVAGAVQDFADNAVVRPVGETLGAVEHIVWKPQDAPQVIGRALTPPPGSFDLGNEIGKFLDPKKKGLLPELPSILPDKENRENPAAEPAPLPALPPVAAPVLDPAAALAGPFLTSPATNSKAALSDTAHDAKSNRQHRDESPSPFSPGQSPLVPLSFPATPGGSTVGGHFDGPLLGIPAAAATVYDYIEPSTLLAGVRHLPFEPGAQPGVTPD
ncbi:hypothetical protein [Amycolatopsis minnesotensis]|uniref:Uncharacterized protein n=1 Tax=Amycolatopsis minnesotensis TaxID=337894 RepID=A0ABN2RIJ1_9PSEU